MAEIEKAGGKVWYDWESADGDAIPGAQCWAPQWLVDSVGVDYFAHVTAAEHLAWMSGSRRVSDEFMVNVGRLTRLRKLRLIASRVTDAGLAHLTALISLEEVAINESPVTDAGLISLRRLPRLKELCLIDTTISDAGLVHLKGLSSLRYLNVTQTDVTDAGIKDLERELPALRIIKMPAWDSRQDVEVPQQSKEFSP